MLLGHFNRAVSTSYLLFIRSIFYFQDHEGNLGNISYGLVIAYLSNVLLCFSEAELLTISCLGTGALVY